MSKFQIILLVVFGFFIILAVGVFALYRGSSAGVSAVTIWGDISQYEFGEWMNDSKIHQDKSVSITYVEKSPDSIDTEFTEALAQDVGPDLIIITQDKLLKLKPKLTPIPYDNISQADFQKTFIEEGELFFDSAGVYALPLAVDPLVLYYNRDLLSSAGIAEPMKYWDEMYSTSQKLTKKDPAGNVTQSVMALGEAKNIPHFKDLLSLLMIQAGNPITGYSGGNLRALLTENFAHSTLPVESALEFYTQFSNPAKTFHSWNRSLTDAQTHFASGQSAYYIGYASELATLRNKNPTLNMAIVPVPQSRVSGKTITFGKLYGLAIARGTSNSGAAFSVATKLVSKSVVQSLSSVLGLPPARRELLSQRQNDPNTAVFYEAALQARGWMDPDEKLTKDLFQEMIESVTSGRARTNEAVNKANDDLNNLIQ